MTYHQFLCPVTGEGRFSKYKTALKNKLEIEVSERYAAVDLIVVDGCLALYHIHWPSHEKFPDLVD